MLTLQIIDTAYRATLEELVHIDLEFAWQKRARDEAAPYLVEDYLRRFPCLNDDAIVGRLLRQECRARRHSGDAAEPDEYRRRFPQYRSDHKGPCME